MLRAGTAACAFIVLVVVLAGGQVFATNGQAPLSLTLHTERTSPLDLEVGGDLRGLPTGTTRYVTREELLKLPQVDSVVRDDSNFTSAVDISGVLLEVLARRLGAAPASDLVVAICDDKYRANYSREYIAAHRPLLVLLVNGKPPSG